MKSLSKLSQYLDSNSGYGPYLDIGREPGTRIDSLWGAGGHCFEFTLDVSFARLVEDIACPAEPAKRS